MCCLTRGLIFAVFNALFRLNSYDTTSFSGTHGDRGMFIFPVQLTTSRIGNLTDIHTYIHTYIHLQCIVVRYYCTGMHYKYPVIIVNNGSFATVS